MWGGGKRGEEAKLESAYRRSLEVASENNLRTVAFPSISTGAYRFPIDRAAAIALHTVADYLENHPEIERVTFVLFSERDLGVYEKEMGKLSGA